MTHSLSNKPLSGAEPTRHLVGSMLLLCDPGTFSMFHAKWFPVSVTVTGCRSGDWPVEF
jgi:hypothetical protein